ncbi:MAG: hypothetical protein HKN40_06770 [Winogradskyella sp.]|uniref:DUF6090 family protein n=1 Tax=Winogradskyella sp. TaxID=1883156 RepID=UPI00181CD85E|nr:hypothetical protein [Winogradskyella sp.]
MIKFFRKIRYDLMEKNKTGKYMKYAIGEILLVVFGILIALSINNWNDHKKQQQKEIVYLTELKKGLESDLAGEFIPSIKIYKRRLESHNKLYAFYENTETFSEDSLTKYFRSCFAGEWDFVFNTAAFENIKSTGIDIISNDSIRSKISTLYSYSYPNIREVNQNFIRYHDLQISPIIYDNINLRNNPLTSGELAFLKNSFQIRNRLGRLYRRTSFLHLRLLMPVQENVESLINDIDLELTRLKE